VHLLAETDHSWVAGVQANVYLGTRGGDCAGSTMLRLNVLVVVRAECITTSRITSKSQMCGQSCGQYLQLTVCEAGGGIIGPISDYAYDVWGS